MRLGFGSAEGPRPVAGSCGGPRAEVAVNSRTSRPVPFCRCSGIPAGSPRGSRREHEVAQHRLEQRPDALPEGLRALLERFQVSAKPWFLCTFWPASARMSLLSWLPWTAMAALLSTMSLTSSSVPALSGPRSMRSPRKTPRRIPVGSRGSGVPVRGRFRLDPVVAERAQQILEFLPAAVHVADDVHRSRVAPAVVDQCLALDLGVPAVLRRLDPELAAEALLGEALQAPLQGLPGPRTTRCGRGSSSVRFAFWRWQAFSESSKTMAVSGAFCCRAKFAMTARWSRWRFVASITVIGADDLPVPRLADQGLTAPAGERPRGSW